MNGLFPVMIGGALGSGARYLVGVGLATRLGSGFPWGTLTVNLVGGLLMGVLAGLVARGSAGETTRLFLAVGILGGFTTFSAFSLDCWTMLERGTLPLAAAYIALSVIGSVLLLMAGVAIGRAA